EPPPDVAQVGPGIPPALSGVVQKAMAKQPDDRYPSAGDFGRAAVAASQQHSLPDVQGSVAVGQAAGDTPTTPQATVIPTVAAQQATNVAGGGQTVLEQPARKRPPVALIAGGIGALVVIAVVAVVIASSSSSTSSGGADPKK